jgi:hypothetical protein
VQTLTTLMSLTYLTFLIEEPLKVDRQLASDFSSVADRSIADKGSILQNSISAENFFTLFLILKLGTNFHPKIAYKFI